MVESNLSFPTLRDWLEKFPHPELQSLSHCYGDKQSFLGTHFALKLWLSNKSFMKFFDSEWKKLNLQGWPGFVFLQKLKRINRC